LWCGAVPVAGASDAFTHTVRTCVVCLKLTMHLSGA
jgi:hypothetical protein